MTPRTHRTAPPAAPTLPHAAGHFFAPRARVFRTLPGNTLKRRAGLRVAPGFSSAKDYGHLVQSASTFIKDVSKGTLSSGWMPHGRRE